MRRYTAVISIVAALLAAAADASPAVEPRRAFDLGGAVRINYGWLDYVSDSGNLDLELLRLDLACSHGRLVCSAQYRWYDGFSAIHHAWVGFQRDPANRVSVGVQQAPFGLLPYASHSFWFGSGYYLGVEDDYDLGLAWKHERDGWRTDLALFASDEYGTGREPGRYSFDVATTPGRPFRERERLVARVERTIEHGDWNLQLGGSLSTGRIERRPDGRRFDHDAGALHASASRGALELQAQWARYRYAVPGERIALSAFGFPFEIAAEADVFTANLAWTFDAVRWFDSVTCYNDYSSTRASGPMLADSTQNVTGCSFSKGVMVAYVDWIAGRNMWFIGGPGVGIADPDGERWRLRLNINIGFYF